MPYKEMRKWLKDDRKGFWRKRPDLESKSMAAKTPSGLGSATEHP
jgi:hypothetical protein